MPIKLPLSMWAECITARCPTVTWSSKIVGRPGSPCSIAPSCTFVHSPISIRSTSPLTTALYQILDLAATLTDPITMALVAIKAA